MIARETTGCIQNGLISLFCRLIILHRIRVHVKIIPAIDRIFFPTPPRCLGTNERIDTTSFFGIAFYINRGPVILYCRRSPIEDISIHIPLTRSPRSRTTAGFLGAKEILLVRRVRTNFIVVVDKITLVRRI